MSEMRLWHSLVRGVLKFLSHERLAPAPDPPILALLQRRRSIRMRIVAQPAPPICYVRGGIRLRLVFMRHQLILGPGSSGNGGSGVGCPVTAVQSRISIFTR